MEVIKLPFVKMQGAGNDYVYMDTIGNTPLKTFPEKFYPELAREVSERHFGVGSDGLILILPSVGADFYMRIFNADGSEAQMCGNGIRCVGKYVYEKGLTRSRKLRIETLGGIKELFLHVINNRVNSVTVDMGKPVFDQSEIPVASHGEEPVISEKITIEDMEFSITAIGMGNPHCVIFVDKADDRLLHYYGPRIEHYKLFPERTNVEFVEIIDSHKIRMRVWERGSGETLACGTGACASVVAAFINGHTEREVEVDLSGGKLKVNYDKDSGHIFMTGGAEFIAEGYYYLKNKL